MARSFHKLTLTAVLLSHCLIGYNLAKTTTNIITDQSSLLALKSRITSDPYNILANNWTTANGVANSVCSWTGVACGARHLRVTALDISDMGLRGSIPTDIGNLTFLVYLNMSSNFFHGSLPKELPILHRLRVVDLSLNNLQGELPSSWSSSRLEILRLHGNALRGMIPEEIGKLPQLKDLRLQNNMLTGPIPATLFNLSSLQLVNLRNNSLSGSLPVDMCSRLINLRGLNVARNKLYGGIPADLSRCSRLQILSMSYNSFSGPVPSEIGNLTALEELLLGFNSLSGMILF